MKAVSNGIKKLERVRVDRLRWKTKHLAGLEDVRVRGGTIGTGRANNQRHEKGGKE